MDTPGASPSSREGWRFFVDQLVRTLYVQFMTDGFREALRGIARAIEASLKTHGNAHEVELALQSELEKVFDYFPTNMASTGMDYVALQLKRCVMRMQMEELEFIFEDERGRVSIRNRKGNW